MKQEQIDEMIAQFLHPTIDKADPIILSRLAKIKRLEVVREVVNNALAKKQYTRPELYQVCLWEHIIEVGSYKQFMKDLKELEDEQLIHTRFIRAEEKNDMPPAWLSGAYLRKIMQVIREDDKISWEHKARLCVTLLLGLRQGMRVGEVTKQKWFRIKLDENKMVIWDSKEKNRALTKFGEGKTRYIKLMPDMKNVLIRYKKMLGVADDDTYLFPSNTNPKKPLEPKTIANWMAEILKKIGLRDKRYLIRPPHLDKRGNEKKTYLYRFHTLRHTCAYYILLVTDGDYHSAQDFLGHESSETTKDCYAGLLFDRVGDKILRGENKGIREFNHNYMMQKRIEDMNNLMEARVDMQAHALKVKENDKRMEIELEKLRIERMKLEKSSDGIKL